jgi:hypothetical protein
MLVPNLCCKDKHQKVVVACCHACLLKTPKSVIAELRQTYYHPSMHRSDKSKSLFEEPKDCRDNGLVSMTVLKSSSQA